MDYGGILRRAWRITWDNKYLWVLGFLTALGSGGRNFGNGRGYNFGGGDFGRGLPFEGPMPSIPGLGPGGLEPGPIIGIVAAVLCVLLLIALVVWVVSTIARGGLISATNQIEDTDVSSFREGWRAGVSNMWRMLGVSLVQAIPGIVVGIVLLALFVMGVFAFVGASGPSAFLEDPAALLATGGAALACLIPLMCIVGLVALALAILRPFADRACVMEGEPVFASYRRGWEVLKDNFGDSLVLGIIRVIGGLVIGAVVAAPFILLAVIAGVSFGVGALAAGPDALSGLAAPVIVAVACGVLVFVVVAAVVSAATTTFFSSMWTLAYRQFVGTQPQVDIRPDDAPAPV